MDLLNYCMKFCRGKNCLGQSFHRMKSEIENWRHKHFVDKMQWQYEQYQTKIVNGDITNIISSKKSDSLVLLRHKETPSSETSELTVFYFQDMTDDLSKWKVYDGLKDHQRVIQISLQGRYMKDLN